MLRGLAYMGIINQMSTWLHPSHFRCVINQLIPMVQLGEFPEHFLGIWGEK